MLLSLFSVAIGYFKTFAMLSGLIGSEKSKTWKVYKAFSSSHMIFGTIFEVVCCTSMNVHTCVNCALVYVSLSVLRPNIHWIGDIISRQQHTDQ